MSTKLILIAASSAAMLLLSLGCNSCGNPPPATTPVGNPAAFIGTWQLTVGTATTPTPMVLRRATNPTPTAPGDLSLEGSYGTNSRVTGNANGNVFVGTVVYGNNATALEMRMVAPGQAVGTYSAGMNARDLIGARMNP